MTDKNRLEPAFDDDFAADIERIAASQNMGITRRLALAACAHRSATLRQLAGERELHAKVVASIREWRMHLEQLLEVARAAETRLLAAKPGLRVVSDKAAEDPPASRE